MPELPEAQLFSWVRGRWAWLSRDTFLTDEVWTVEPGIVRGMKEYDQWKRVLLRLYRRST